LDIIFVTGDAYIDHPAFGVPLLARWLEAHGFRVGIISQPDWRSAEPFRALGRPRLFFAVSAGAMDSMVAHYTARKKLRHDDAYTPGGRHGARPNRATIIYTSRLKEAWRNVPVLIGGIEASLRRLAHYDYWDDRVRRSILLDAKADLLIYGMAELALLELAQRMRNGEKLDAVTDIRGTACASTEQRENSILLPSFEELNNDKELYLKAFSLAEKEQNPYCARGLVQPHGNRFVICNPPAMPLTTPEMDEIYALPFTREPHPLYKESIPAFEQIKNSITSHRGCYGGCSFCAITSHQGKFIQSRSALSIVSEVKALALKSWFRGAISDLGGPTANMSGTGCAAPDKGKNCRRVSCLYPAPCHNLKSDDRYAVDLLRRTVAEPAVRSLTVSSGIRYDLMELQPNYFKVLVERHTGGLLKVAPEHLVDKVTAVMRKPGRSSFIRFIKRFKEESSRIGKRQTVLPYLISGHPGSTLDDMIMLARELRGLGLKVEQVQEFTPTPGTAATCIYHTGLDPENGQKLFVAKTDREKILQKSVLLWHLPEERQRVKKMLLEDGRLDLLQMFDFVIDATDAGKAGLKNNAFDIKRTTRR